MDDKKTNKKIDENEEKDPFSDEEEFKKMLESLIETETGQKTSTRVLVFGNQLFKNVFLDFLFILILNMFLFVGTDGLFRIYNYENIGYLLIFIGSFSVIEYVFKRIMYKYGLKIVLKSLGTINLFITVLAIGGSLYATYLLFNLGIDSFPKFVITLVGILIVRSMLCSNIRMRMLRKGKIK